MCEINKKKDKKKKRLKSFLAIVRPTANASMHVKSQLR
jgi:hypothetical protein